MNLVSRILLAATTLLVALGAEASGFSLEDIQGKTLRLSDFSGKWVLVNFWATWCPPCLDEIPELVNLHNAHKDRDLQVIGIAMDSGDRYRIAKFAKAHGMVYPVVMGDSRSQLQIGPVDVLPASYLYNPQGKLVNYQAGKVTRASVEALIRKQ